MTQRKRTEEQKLLDRVVSTGAYPTAVTLCYLDRDTKRLISADDKEPTDYRDRLFASNASKRLRRRDVASIIRSDSQGLTLYLLITAFCTALTIASVYLLYFELTTGTLINITGQIVYGGAPLVWPLDPVFFTISAAFGLLLTATFVWLAVKKVSKIKLARHLEGRLS